MFERNVALVLLASLLHACSSKDETNLMLAGPNVGSPGAPAGSGGAQPAQGAPNGVLPNGALPNGVLPGAAPWVPPSTAALGRVAALAPSRRVPSFLWADRSARGRIQASLPSRAQLGQSSGVELAARAHLTEFAPYYRMNAAQVSALELRHVQDLGRGPRIARFARRIGGVEVFGEQLAVAMDQNLEVVAFSGSIDGEATVGGKHAPASPGLDPAQAVIAALADITNVRLEASELEPPQVASGDYVRMALLPEAARRAGVTSSTAPRVKPVLYPSANGALVNAFYVEVDAGKGATRQPRAFSFVVGQGGELLWKKNLTSFDNPYSYRVYADADGLYTPWDGPQGTAPSPHPTGEPDDYQAPFVPANLVTISSLTAVGVNDPWLPPGATSTLGNNADAYMDLVAPDGFTPGRDFRAPLSSPGSFDYPFAPELDVANDAQRLGALTQVFYTVNWLHDWFYAGGFTETNGNAQFSNYGRGGLEGDAMRIEGQDESGWCNANMNVPADGERPTMQMYVYDYGSSALKLSTPPELAGEYETAPAYFAPQTFEVHGKLVRAEPADGCGPLLGNYDAALVLIDDGACDPIVKAENAQAAGAAGAVIAKTADSSAPTRVEYLFGPAAKPLAIGVLSVNQETGDRLREGLAAGAEPLGTLARDSLLRDADVDNLTVAHEWGHYISGRLIGDGSGLDTNMSGGLGEGWADFHMFLMIVREEDTNNPSNAHWNGAYSASGYSEGTFSEKPYYNGIRRYPYSTDLAKNPLTFIHISDDGKLPEGVPSGPDRPHNEVHAIGEVWGTMLWECYAALLRDTQGPHARLRFAEARDRMRDYLVASYQLTPRSPTLLEARDALLAAALINDPLDHARFAAAFAKRGAGVLAEAPDRYDPENRGVVESYATGAAVVVESADLTDDVAHVCALDGSLDNGETGTLRLTFANVGNAATEGSSALVATTTSGLSLTGGGTVTIPPLPIQGSVELSVPVTAARLSGISTLGFTVQVSDTGAGAPPPRSFEFAGNQEPIANQSTTDTVESAPTVWKTVFSDATLPLSMGCQRFTLAPTEHGYRCPSAPVSATADFVSPPLIVPLGQQLTVSFRHRHALDAVDDLYFDGGVVEVSRDSGTTWEDIGQGYNGSLFPFSDNPLGGRDAFVGTSPDYPEFKPVTLSIDPEGETVLFVRFRVASDISYASPGWDIDDISFGGLTYGPFDSVVPQPATCNNPPLAVVGVYQELPEAEPTAPFAPTLVVLDGSASFDAEGDTLTYHWLQLWGPPVELSGADGPLPTFSAPDVPDGEDVASMAFQLTVEDGTLLSAPVLTYLDILDTPAPAPDAGAPSADAGAAQSADAGVF